MSIDAKHAYRFGFLRSEKWKNFRLQALAANDGACYVCGKKALENDVHHIKYPERWQDTKVGHVVILCRKHHKIVHRMMERYPKAGLMGVTTMVKRDTNRFYRILRSIGESNISLERWMDRENMFQSVWKYRRKLLTVGRIMK